MTRKIAAPEGSVYCSEFMSTIPEGIIDKHDTGCGLTSVALENNEAYIVVVPTIEIIKNKVNQYPNERRAERVFGVYGTIKEVSFRDYVSQVEIPKVLVTYDSFEKLTRWLGEGLNKYKVVVDEFSDLLDAYSYREKAIESLLRTVKQYAYVSYISATPIKAEYLPEELTGLPMYEINWGRYTKLTVKRKKTNKPYRHAVNIIEKYLIAGDEGVEVPGHPGKYSHSAYFFLNSVNAIASILEEADIPAHMVRVICADDTANAQRLYPHKISTALDEEKKFNFITSTAFKGCDFYSETGVIYVVTNTQSLHTLLSIDTDIRQIVGRIRTLENPFRTTVNHIFNTNKSSLSKEELEDMIAQKKKNTQSLIELWSMGTEAQKAAFIIQAKAAERYEKGASENYLHIHEDGTLSYNEYLPLTEYRRWEVAHEAYKSGYSLRESYIEAGFDIEECQEYIHEESQSLSRLGDGSFKAKCLEYIENEKSRTYLADRYPLIKDAFDILGKKRMVTLNFSQTRLKKELILRLPDSKQLIKSKIEEELQGLEPVSVSAFNSAFEEAVKLLDPSYKFKPSDRKYYYPKIKTASRRVKGQNIKCVTGV